MKAQANSPRFFCHHSPTYESLHASSSVSLTGECSANMPPDISVARLRMNETAAIVTLPSTAPLASFAVTVTSVLQAVAEEKEKMLAAN